MHRKVVQSGTDMMQMNQSLISMMKKKSNEPIKFVKKRSARFGGSIEKETSLNQVRNISDFLLGNNNI